MNEKLQSQGNQKIMDSVLIVLGVIAGIIGLIGGLLALVNLKIPGIWVGFVGLVLACFTLCLFLHHLVRKQEVESVKQQEESTKKIIAEFIAAYEAKNQDLLKQRADKITSDQESVKSIIESAKNDPATANATVRAIAVSPALEEAIRQIDPNSALLPEEKRVTGGTIVLNGVTSPNGQFEIQIRPNTVLNGGLSPGVYRGKTDYNPGDWVSVNFSFSGLDIRSGPGIIEGPNYDKLYYYESEVILGGDPIPLPNDNVPSVISSRFTFQAKFLVFTTNPNLPSAQMVRSYVLHGRGNVKVELIKGEFYRPRLFTFKFDA